MKKETVKFIGALFEVLVVGYILISTWLLVQNLEKKDEMISHLERDNAELRVQLDECQMGLE